MNMRISTQAAGRCTRLFDIDEQWPALAGKGLGHANKAKLCELAGSYHCINIDIIT